MDILSGSIIIVEINDYDMRYLSCILILSVVFCSACSRALPHAVQTDEKIELFPDYRGVTIPCNIAPLNFKLKTPAKAILLLTHGDVQVRIDSEQGFFQIPQKKWKQLLVASTGKTVEVELYVCQKDQWLRYKPFQIFVAKEKIDPYLVYRRIAPGYRMWNEMGIYQRNLEDFTETAFLTNKQTNNNCMNCHSFCMQSPDRMLFHQRMTHAGTYILTDGKVEKLGTKVGEKISALVYPYWHSSGRFVAFSTNDTKQDFHLWDENRIEVFDSKSDVVVYDVEKQEVFTSQVLSSEDNLETFPTFSPDGKSLYYCSAPTKQMPESYKEIKYNLLRISFDEKTRALGTKVDTIYAAEREGRSVKFPRISPDGRYLMYTLSDYGNFSIWHKNADLCLIDLETLQTDYLEKVNSGDVESYHSWSSNSRWIVFSSRRGDGLYTRPYLVYMNEQGKMGQPFLLPQEDTDYYDFSLFSFNIPELVKGKVEVDTYKLIELSKYGKPHTIQMAN